MKRWLLDPWFLLRDIDSTSKTPASVIPRFDFHSTNLFFSYRGAFLLGLLFGTFLRALFFVFLGFLFFFRHDGCSTLGSKQLVWETATFGSGWASCARAFPRAGQKKNDWWLHRRSQSQLIFVFSHSINILVYPGTFPKCTNISETGTCIIIIIAT